MQWMMYAASSPLDGIPWERVANYGAWAVVVILMLTGYLYPKPMIDYLHRENRRLQEDNEKLRGENTELRVGIQERVVPALERVTTLVDRMAERSNRQ